MLFLQHRKYLYVGKSCRGSHLGRSHSLGGSQKSGVVYRFSTFSEWDEPHNPHLERHPEASTYFGLPILKIPRDTHWISLDLGSFFPGCSMLAASLHRECDKAYFGQRGILESQLSPLDFLGPEGITEHRSPTPC